MPNPSMKRVTVRPQCPNPLFETWLDEWRQEAASKGSDLQFCFGKALKSLRKYPLNLKSGKECAVLENFGDKLCSLLDRKLAEYQKAHPEGINVIASQTPAPAAESVVSKRKKKVDSGLGITTKQAAEPPSKVARQSRQRPYVPAWRSGPYALLITLQSQEKQPNYPGYLTKEALQREAQPLCDTSFTRPDPGSYYTAWSSMSQLVKKGLVNKYSNPAKFNLTEEGRQLAEELYKKGEPGESLNTESVLKVKPSYFDSSSHMVPNGKAVFKTGSVKKYKKHVSSSTSDFEPTSICAGSSMSIEHSEQSSKLSSGLAENYVCPQSNSTEVQDAVLEPGTFDVILLVDTAETVGAAKKKHDQTLAELTDMKVPFEVRHLSVGDFIWIARSKTTTLELVLPYIVERKRMDDFGGSVKGGRYLEQKFRLKRSGVQNQIYLVESHGSDQHVGLPLTSLQQAAVNTQVVDGFFVKRSIDHRHSMAYLASITRVLCRTYMGRTLLGCPKKDLTTVSVGDDFILLMKFKEFYDTNLKVRNFLVKEMFIRHLVQMKTLSVDKARAIVARYPTPMSLVSAYSNKEDETLLANIPCGSQNRHVGPVISRALYKLYRSEKLS